VKFIADRNGLPQQKLEVVMRAHTGVDPLYDQVLSEARKFDQFERVVGAVMFLRESSGNFTVRELEQFLRLQPGSVRLALCGCQSILVIPDRDDIESVRPYHASLRDFLTDNGRAKNHFFNPMVHHISILADCGKLITEDMERDVQHGKHLKYACRNWCYHLSLVLLHGGGNSDIQSCFHDWVGFIVRMQQQWLKPWMYNFGNFKTVKTINDDLCHALERMTVSALLLFTSLY
jgi:hypothetical protein